MRFNPTPQRLCQCGKWIWLPNYHAHREYACPAKIPTNGIALAHGGRYSSVIETRSNTMATRHATRQVRLIRVAHDAVNGTHLHVMRSGTMAEVLAYLRATYIHCSQGTLFFYDNGPTDNTLRPLVA